MPLNANWSDSEGEEEEWNGDQQKEKELKELKLKNNNITAPQSPQYQSTSTTNTDETLLAPQLTNTLAPLKMKEQKEDNMQTILEIIPRQMSIWMIQ